MCIHQRENRFSETQNLLALIDSLHLSREHRILDVGCGYGKNLTLLEKRGLRTIGVDINESIVKANLANGLNCLTPKEWNKTSESYDLIIMSHIIEHFSPVDLLNFVEGYLSRIKVGGYLIIVTPFMSRVFFNDFDHIKPYPPEALTEMFIVDKPQSQFFSKYRLELIEIRVRRRRIRLSPAQDSYLSQHWPRLRRLITFLLHRSYELSAGFIGQTDGWIGLYRNKGCRTTVEYLPE